jgi:hypothetical protein
MSEDPLYETHLAFSKLAYESSDVQQEVAKSMGYSLDSDLSTKNVSVFHHPDSRNTVVAFRGTAEVADLPVDGLAFLNLSAHSSRFKNAKRLAKQVIEKYGISGTSTTGHSLGGAQAIAVNRETGIKSSAFNPVSSVAGRLVNTIEKVSCAMAPGTRRCRNARNSSVYLAAGDLISERAGGADGKVKRVKPKGTDYHSLNAF